VPRSLTDLAGLNVSAADFLSAVLETVGQPIWVVDPDDVIRFANPAALAALGYHGADELFGRRTHETIHYQHPDGTPYPATDCPMLLPRATGDTVASELDWFFRRDGSMFPVSYVSVPLEMSDGRGAVVAFTDIEDRMRSHSLPVRAPRPRAWTRAPGPYFVVAEALTNVTKHSGARHAAVTARVKDRTLQVHVRDDGAGGARPDGSGLLGLAGRLAVLGGRLRVESPPDGGTLIAAEIPLRD
jgi:PAS domain S-box-containing protein